MPNSIQSLHLGPVAIRIFGEGTEYAIQVQIGIMGNLLDEISSGWVGNADPSQPGIDFDPHGHPAIQRVCSLREPARRVRGEDGGSQAELEDGIRLIPAKIREANDPAVNPVFAQFDAFAHTGDAEKGYAGGGQALGHGDSTCPVRIGFDHSHDPGFANQRPDTGQVVEQI